MKKYIVLGALVLIGIGAALHFSIRPSSDIIDQSAEKQEKVSAVSVKSTDMEQSIPLLELESAMKTPEEESPVIRVIDPEAGYQERLAAMRMLGREMSTNDVAVLMGFLKDPMPEDAKLRPLSYNSIRNDAYEILLRQEELPEGMGELLIEGYNRPDQDDMWRNYCLQFMPSYYERVATAKGSGARSVLATNEDTPSGDSSSQTPELAVIQETLWDALGERDNSNAGTALLALDKLSRNHEEFKREEINAAMLDLASDESASLANRVTAIRLCGEHKNIQALEAARDLARNADATMLRCAAIATLGEIGTEEDMVFLETLTASRDQRISSIAATSLKKRN